MLVNETELLPVSIELVAQSQSCSSSYSPPRLRRGGKDDSPRTNGKRERDQKQARPRMRGASGVTKNARLDRWRAHLRAFLGQVADLTQHPLYYVVAAYGAAAQESSFVPPKTGNSRITLPSVHCRWANVAMRRNACFPAAEARLVYPQFFTGRQ